MNTTSLFVELVVIGAGVFTSILLLILALFGADWFVLDNALLLASAIPVLSIIYVSGILCDRLADVVFNRFWGDALRARFYRELGEYYDDRRSILTGAPALAELLEYGRSRLRICRGWSINALLLGAGFNLYCWLQLGHLESIAGVIAFGNLVCLALLFGCWLAWRNLTLTEYRKIRDQSRYLAELPES